MSGIPRPAATGRTAEILRRVAVHAAGLGRTTGFGRGRPGAQAALAHLGAVQIDTISVVARAHDHVLASRVPGYAPDHLHQLIRHREAFEYWSHAAAYLPMTDYRQALPRMQRFAAGGSHWGRPDLKVKAEVLARIRAEGPLRARDFAAPPGHQGGWWQWKPAKQALERLFQEGVLMVDGRDGFEKRFDLAERVLPAGLDLRAPDLAEHADWLVARARSSLGAFGARHCRYLRREDGIAPAVTRALADAVERGELVRLEPDALPGSSPWYVDRAGLETAARPITRRVRALSPFDPLVLHRDRLAALFNFDYQLECYVPAARRRFGYFSLPLLAGTRFVGRADCKAERGERLLRCRHLAFEPGRDDAESLKRVHDGLLDLAEATGCKRILYERVSGLPAASSRRFTLETPRQ